ncbi:ATP-binding protein [Streptomyces sp. WAC 06738]|nr:ATP-binding protein [Streptomyces sp. WAC 06738]
MAATAVPAYCETLPRTAPSVAKARRLISASLRVWSLDAGVAAACLIVSELATNSVKHARGPTVLVRVSRPGPRRVRVAVVDLSRTLPTLITAGVDDETGRGMAALADLSAAWGADPLPWGKRVWAELDVPQEDS